MFLATSNERLRRMQISRLALCSGLERTFTFDEALTTATVAPPAPFAGTATFQRNPDGSTTWTGSLSVSFPGAENVALTGPRFRTHLSQSP